MIAFKSAEGLPFFPFTSVKPYAARNSSLEAYPIFLKKAKPEKKKGKAGKGKKKKRFSITNFLLTVILLVGLGILAYPKFSDWWNSFHQSRAIAGYVEKVADMDQKDIDKLWKEAEEYNAALRTRSGRFNMSPEEVKE